MNTVKKIYKKKDGIKFFSDKAKDGYRLWESLTHPRFNHFSKCKTKELEIEKEIEEESKKMIGFFDFDDLSFDELI